MLSFLAWLEQPGAVTSVGLTLLFCFLFVILIVGNITGKVSWYDLICRNNTQVISLSKVLQLVGGIVASWVIIKTAISPTGVSWELFTAYLMYVGSVEGYSKYIMMKTATAAGNDESMDTKTTTTTTTATATS